MKIRTDLAMEAESFTTATGKLQGIKVTEKKEVLAHQAAYAEVQHSPEGRQGLSLSARRSDAGLSRHADGQQDGRGQSQLLRPLRRPLRHAARDRHAPPDAQAARLLQAVPARSRQGPPVPQLPHEQLRRLVPALAQPEGLSRPHGAGCPDPAGQL